jgi:hypothetical protein
MLPLVEQNKCATREFGLRKCSKNKEDGMMQQNRVSKYGLNLFAPPCVCYFWPVRAIWSDTGFFIALSVSSIFRQPKQVMLRTLCGRRQR